MFCSFYCSSSLQTVFLECNKVPIRESRPPIEGQALVDSPRDVPILPVSQLYLSSARHAQHKTPCKSVSFLHWCETIFNNPQRVSMLGALPLFGKYYKQGRGCAKFLAEIGLTLFWLLQIQRHENRKYMKSRIWQKTKGLSWGQHKAEILSYSERFSYTCIVFML